MCLFLSKKKLETTDENITELCKQNNLVSIPNPITDQ